MDRTQIEAELKLQQGKLTESEGDLLRLAKEVGEAVVVLHSQENSIFGLAEWDSLRSLSQRLDELKLQKQQADSSQSTGFFEKTKKLALSATISGRIVLAEQQRNEAIKQLGHAVLKTNREEELLPASEPLLKRIAKIREDISRNNLSVSAAKAQLDQLLLPSPSGGAPSRDSADTPFVPVLQCIEGKTVLNVFDDKIEIHRKGFGDFLLHGMKGGKSLYYSSITAIQHKPAGKVLSGYLQFTLDGGNEGQGGMWQAVSDENSFVYGYDNEPTILQIKQFIEKKIAEVNRPSASTVHVSQLSLADELEKLAKLRAAGIINDADFEKAKAKLLGL